MIDLKKEAIKTGLGLLYIIFLIWFITFFKLNFWQIFGFLWVNRIGYMMITKTLTIKKLFTSGIYLLIILYMFKFLNYFGVYGYITGIIIICGLIIASRWGKYIEVKQHIEKMLWGKPLYKFKKEGKKPPNPFF